MSSIINCNIKKKKKNPDIWRRKVVPGDNDLLYLNHLWLHTVLYTTQWSTECKTLHCELENPYTANDFRVSLFELFTHKCNIQNTVTHPGVIISDHDYIIKYLGMINLRFYNRNIVTTYSWKYLQWEWNALQNE